MDSLSQSDASQPPNEAIAQAIAPVIESPSPASISKVDLIVRMGLFAVLLLALARQIAPVDSNQLVYPLLVYGALTAGYLLASFTSFADELRLQAEQQPLTLALVSLALLLPVMVYARATPDFDVSELLFAGVLILLPVGCAILNTPALHRGDVSLGLITAVLPILLPFARETVNTGSVEPLTAMDVALRAGAFALPVLLLLLTTREQKKRLNFLFICAVLSLWFAVEFDAFPDVAIEPAIEVSYFQFAVIPLFLYVLALASRFGRLGLSFTPSPHGLSVVSANFGLFAVMAVPLGLITGALASEFAGPTPLEMGVRALMIFPLIALPSEILFRGTLFTYLEDTLKIHPNIVILITALLFGASHLNNGATTGWAFVLAALAGVFYARTFVATRNVAAPAVVHTAVNWAWWLLFKG